MKRYIITTLTTLGLTLSASAVCLAQGAGKTTAGKITVCVGGVRNDNGTVRCGLYASADGFRKPEREFKGVAARITNGRANCVFGKVPAGAYAVAVFHAENNETELETGAFGQPKQGYGFSRNARGSFGPPSFEAAALSYDGGNVTWPVTLQY